MHVFCTWCSAIMDAQNIVRADIPGDVFQWRKDIKWLWNVSKGVARDVTHEIYMVSTKSLISIYKSIALFDRLLPESDEDLLWIHPQITQKDSSRLSQKIEYWKSFHLEYWRPYKYFKGCFRLLSYTYYSVRTFWV